MSEYEEGTKSLGLKEDEKEEPKMKILKESESCTCESEDSECPRCGNRRS